MRQPAGLQHAAGCELDPRWSSRAATANKSFRLFVLSGRNKSTKHDEVVRPVANSCRFVVCLLMVSVVETDVANLYC
jgi:hypothetical protein